MSVALHVTPSLYCGSVALALKMSCARGAPLRAPAQRCRNQRQQRHHGWLPASLGGSAVRLAVVSRSQARDRGGRGRTSVEDDPLRAQEVAVPSDQRPANELKAIKQAPLYSWATLPFDAYVQRLGLIFLFFFSLVGGPISYQTFDPLEQPIEWALSASVGSLVVVAIVVVRIYLGWNYVGNRLMSAAVEYEETGWYDGETFVKPPELLTRDRLLGTYEVKPVMDKLRKTLVGSGAALLTAAVLLTGIIQASTDADGMYGRGAARGAQPRVTADGLIFSDKVLDLRQLAEDDELAAEEAASLGGIPGYCRDRLLRAAAGGQYCSKFDVR